MQYGYARVSTVAQKIDRQLEDLHKAGLSDSCIFVDKESGKDFERLNYKRLLRRLKVGDVLFIKSIDRLGRDYVMVLEQWRVLTKEMGVDIVVIDMPLLDTRIEGKNLVGKFIADLVLQILSFVAQNEREVLRQRQAEGIRMAKIRGVQFGRPRVTDPKNLKEAMSLYLSGAISSKEAREMTGLSQGTFFRRMKAMSEGKA